MNRVLTTTLILLLASSVAATKSADGHPTGSRTTPPTIESIAPRGVTTGATHTLIVEGYNLRRASSVHFSDSSVSGRVVEVSSVPDVPEPPRLGAAGLISSVDLGPLPPRYRVEIELSVDANADLGPVRFRLATDFGISPEGKVLVEPAYHVASEGRTGTRRRQR